MRKWLRSNIDLVCFVAAIGILVTVFISDCTGKNVTEEKIEYALPKPHEGTDTVYLEEFSENNLLKKINREGILYGNIVMAQAKLETGHFKSQLFKENNNLFGFVGKKGYIKYISWQESVEAYKDWQLRCYKSGDYYNFLERIGYAADTTYVEKLRRMD